jgi:hypothetical protein
MLFFVFEVLLPPPPQIHKALFDLVHLKCMLAILDVEHGKIFFLHVRHFKERTRKNLK